MDEKKTTKPVFFMILKIIGFALLAIGIIILITNLNKQVPSMGSNGWFEAERSKSFGIFAGIAFSMISIFIISIAFSPEIKKLTVKTTKYVLDENKDDIKSIADTSAEIGSDAITTVTKSIKKGLKDTKFCKHCGTEIDADSRFCNTCGKEQ